MVAEALRTGPITLDSSLPPGMLTFRALSGQERLGQPFCYRLEVTSKNDQLSGTDLIGKPVTLHIELATGDLRHIHALVTSLEHGGDQRNAHYFLTLRPWIWLLTQTHNCRIFQDKTIPEIVRTVFRDRGLTDFEEHLFETYQPREMVVQYCESDFNFVSRLLEEEGIYYFFKHEAAKHLLVLADSQSSHARDPNCAMLPYYLPDEHEQRFREGVDQWAPVEHFRPDQFATKNYDFKHPGADLSAMRQHETYPSVSGLEVFEYPGPHLTKDHGEEIARLRLEELHSTLRVIEGNTNAPALLMGRLFELTDHPRAAENAEYLVTSTSLMVRAAELESGHHDTGSDYRCQFEAMSSKTPFRPPRVAPKPYLRGPQTAVVVTSGKEDIWTDEHGRIRVKFDWDRFGPTDETASAWVRVAQLWAGSGWGAQFIPRVGMEVVVQYLEGDPDHPLVTGCVYNGVNRAPYAPNTSATQSGIKTRSSKEGKADNFNELRFEDKKGSEELHVQAEKDYTTLVKNDQTTDILRDRTTTITRNDTLDVTGDQQIHIHGNLAVTVDGAGKSPGPIKSSMSVTGAHDMKASDSISMAAPNKITLTVGGSSITITPSSIAISTGGSQIVLDGHVLAASKDGSKVVLDANALARSSKGSDLVLDANVLAKSSGGSKVVLDGSAMVKGGDKATVTGSTVIVKGGKVSHN